MSNRRPSAAELQIVDSYEAAIATARRTVQLKQQSCGMATIVLLFAKRAITKNLVPLTFSFCILFGLSHTGYLRTLLPVSLLSLVGYQLFAARQRITCEFQNQATIKSLAVYQDEKLLEFARSFPVAKFYPQIGQQLFQPAEGYCGHATINNLLHSIPACRTSLIQLPDLLTPLSLYDMRDLLQSAILMNSIIAASIESYDTFGSLTYEQFVFHMKEVNNPKYRFMANFLRGPLFFSCPTVKPSIFQRTVSGHWSPIISFIESDQQTSASEHEGLVLVSDVNEKYGQYLVPSRRMWQSVATTSLFDGVPRGIIRVTLKSS